MLCSETRKLQFVTPADAVSELPSSHVKDGVEHVMNSSRAVTVRIGYCSKEGPLGRYSLVIIWTHQRSKYRYSSSTRLRMRLSQLHDKLDI
jgi:hypothetical protein